MALASDEKIEAAILAYVNDPLLNGGVPTRDGAIRYITGEMTAMPSGIAKVIRKLVEAGTMKHIDEDRLLLVKKKT